MTIWRVSVCIDNVFEVCLLKNTSGLGFSFSREENIPDEPHGSSMVRVKKLFPGQPAAESGRINVGDVIMRVNQTSLKGLSQHVSRIISLLQPSLEISGKEKLTTLFILTFVCDSLRRWYQLCGEQDRRWLCSSVDPNMGFFLKWTLQL